MRSSTHESTLLPKWSRRNSLYVYDQQAGGKMLLLLSNPLREIH